MDRLASEANSACSESQSAAVETADHGFLSPRAPARRSEASRRRFSAWRCWLLERLLAVVGNPPLTLVLPDGTEIRSESVSSVTRLQLRDDFPIVRFVLDPFYEFGEQYSAGRMDIDGDLVEFVTTMMQAAERSSRSLLGKPLSRLVSLAWHRPRSTSLSQARQNIYHHYGIGNDFYKLWLDEQLVYTCAYFPSPSTTLEEAQVAKMDHVCRKLGLQPGQTVLEAGCGWGALALHMARHYDVKVKAINVSHKQIVYARERAEREGLQDRVEYSEDDWRNISGRFDVFVSVGMLEHVGLKNYRRLGDVIHNCLKPHGRGLIHSIGRNKPRPMDPWIERHIFPGAYPPSLREAADIWEPHDFSILDIENIRLHYAETLRQWLERFERSVDQVREMFDERFVRMWRLYLAGSIAAFETGGMQLFQILFARGKDNTIPWTREYMYPDRC